MRTDEEFKKEIFDRALQYKRNKTKQSFKMISIIAVLAIIINSLGSSNNTIQAVNLVENIKPNEVKEISINDDFISDQIDFSISIFKENYTNDKNTLISPISAMFALSMCANGAVNETLQEMEKVLGNHYTIDQLNNYLYSLKNHLSNEELKVANSIWFNDTFDANPIFLQTCVDYYQSDIFKTEFNQNTVNDINQWINKNTNGKIEKAVDKIDSNTIMYLLNALSFEAEWNKPYEKKQVRKNEFMNIMGNREFVDMMFSSEYNYIESENAIGFIKDYENRNYSFVAILPNDSLSLNEYIEKFDSEEYLNLMKSKQTYPVTAGLPKFSYEQTINMNELLKNMGINKAFDERKAEFYHLGNSEFNLYIRDVIQKTSITVDTKGTKAGAVTSVSVDESASMIEKEVILNRPFIYMIIDYDTKLPIFIGSIVSLENPS